VGELHSTRAQQNRQLADLLALVGAPNTPGATGPSAMAGWAKPRLAFQGSEKVVAQFETSTTAWLLTTAPDHFAGGGSPGFYVVRYPSSQKSAPHGMLLEDLPYFCRLPVQAIYNKSGPLVAVHRCVKTEASFLHHPSHHTGVPF
jgi:hypothetical protein